MTHDKPDSSTPTEDLTSSLIVQLRRGDEGAGALLDRLYREKLVRFCWGYLGRLEEAEDAVQDVCYRILSAGSIPDAFRPWLYKTARNQCLSALRRRARRRDGEPLPAPSQVHEVLTGHLTRLVKEEERSRLSEFVAGLPEEQREVLRLRYVEGLSRAEIAEVLEIPESVVKSRLFEGIKRLRERASLL